ERIGSYETGFIENDRNTAFWWLPNVIALEEACENRPVMADGESYRSLIEGMDEGFVLGDLVRDADGVVIDLRYLDVNQAGLRSLGRPAPEAIGRLRSEVLRPAPLDLLGPFAAAVAAGQMQR